MKKIIISLALAIVMSGCAELRAHVVPTNVTNKPAPISIPQIAPMTLKPIQWHIYDATGLQKLITANPNQVFYVLDETNYNVLSWNLTEMKRYITDQQSSNAYLIAAIGINSKTDITATQAPTVK